MSRITPGPWHVYPDYVTDNEYSLWDKDDNYHEDTSPEVMDANARAIAALPEAIERLEWVAANLENVAAYPEEYPNLHSEATKVRRILARIEGEEG